MHEENESKPSPNNLFWSVMRRGSSIFFMPVLEKKAREEVRGLWLTLAVRFT